jgi:transposase-like protein
LKNLIEGSVEQELKDYLEAREAQEEDKKGYYRNGYTKRDLDTELGVMEEISILRSRDGKFKSL